MQGVNHMHAVLLKAGRGRWSLGTGITDNCELQNGCCESEPGCLGEQSVLLNIQPLLQSQLLPFKCVENINYKNENWLDSFTQWNPALRKFIWFLFIFSNGNVYLQSHMCDLCLIHSIWYYIFHVFSNINVSCSKVAYYMYIQVFT